MLLKNYLFHNIKEKIPLSLSLHVFVYLFVYLSLSRGDQKAFDKR